VEHTHTERRILAHLSHPFIVSLKFAFQSAEKLYLVTDYCQVRGWVGGWVDGWVSGWVGV
jgi:serine/threonine protein kinase